VINPSSLDHVALWVADRDELASFLCDHLGMHVIERTDSFTLVGVDARRGKLTLFAAEGPREPGVLERVVLRTSDLERAVAALPESIHAERKADGVVAFGGPQALGLGLASSNSGPDYDLDHVVLRVPDPERTARGLSELGFARRDGRLAVADRHVRVEGGAAPASERPLLNHLALLIESAAELEAEARRRGLEVDNVVDAPNTLAVFLWGPDRIKLEYVEHKPGFALT
jgi:catechol 2,3-dioxygenase-like lactoylglutathione lyase family enzyme